MWIYKITNKINNKAYIGQTIRPVHQRFNRHVSDTYNKIKDTHFCRALCKYGRDAFVVEIIDHAFSIEELNKKEQYWIKFYNTVQSGYNETDAIYKCGGNTYLSKTEEELNNIKEKIRQSKLGGLNPMARRIKRTNIKTNEVDYFDTIIECAKACGIQKGKTSITSRLSKKCSKPFKGLWIFNYDDKSVSTMSDECSSVGLEISTNSKQETVDNTEDIVSTNGNIG